MLEIEKSLVQVKDPKKKISRDKKTSHVHLQDKHLKVVPKLPASKDVNVIYLYNNEIKIIENLSENHFPNLTSLYLQNNKIQKIDNLKLGNLRKLYIGYNNIAVVEGLENLCNLEELHIEKQSLPPGTCLCFDPRSTLGLSRTLRRLNISHNKVPSFSSLSFLRELENIDASYCDLDDLQDVCQTLRDWKYLSQANFQGNIFSKKHRYREDIISNCYYLESLDGKDISENTRTCLKRLDSRRYLLEQKLSKSVNLADIVKDLPKNYPPPLQKAASAQIIREEKYDPLKTSLTDEANINVYVAWHALPKRRPYVMNRRPKARMDSAIIVNKFP